MIKETLNKETLNKETIEQKQRKRYSTFMRSFRLFRPVLFLLLILATAFSLHAQDADIDDDEEIEDGITIGTDVSRMRNLYIAGDQLFCINLGLVNPLFFYEKKEGLLNTQINLGGMGSLAYNYFLNANVFLGGELGGMFASTLGENMFYIVPIGFRAGYQFVMYRFEFPLSLMVGGALQSYDRRSYFGLFVKPTAGAFFRFNTEWSFGLHSSFWWVPEWTRKSRIAHHRPDNINIHGFFWEISIGARYHF